MKARIGPEMNVTTGFQETHKGLTEATFKSHIAGIYSNKKLCGFRKRSGMRKSDYDIIAVRISLLLAALVMTGMWVPIKAHAAAIPSVTSRASKYLVTNIKKHKNSVDMKNQNMAFSSKSLYKLALDQGKYIFNLQLNNPEIFYISNTGSGWAFYSSRSGRITSIIVGYTMTAAQTKTAQKKYNAAVGKIVRNAKKKKTVKQKVISVNNQICKLTTYNSRRKNSYTAYGALVDRKATCMGYSLAFKDAMNRLGISCTYAMNASHSHIWNKVKVGKKWYHVDVTWNDQKGKYANRYLLKKSH